MGCQIKQLQLKGHERHTLWRPPSLPTTTTTIIHGCHCRHWAPWWLPTFEPTWGGLVNTATNNNTATSLTTTPPNNAMSPAPNNVPNNTWQRCPNATSPAPDNAAQWCHITGHQWCQQHHITSTMPQMTLNDDTMSPHRPHAEHTPSSGHCHHIAIKWRWGWWGKMEEGKECGGIEGRGQWPGMLLFPGVFDNNKGVGWHICAFYFLPPPVLTDKGQCESHMPLSIWLYLPLLWRVFFSMLWTMMGVGIMRFATEWDLWVWSKWNDDGGALAEMLYCNLIAIGQLDKTVLFLMPGLNIILRHSEGDLCVPLPRFFENQAFHLLNARHHTEWLKGCE